MNNLYFLFDQYLKKGGSINIKKENKGKFTASAKAAGKSVQQHATDVLNDSHASKLQKKCAQFAKNAKKFKHKEGSEIHRGGGNKSILDNGFFPIKMPTKKYYDGGGLPIADWYYTLKPFLEFNALQKKKEINKDVEDILHNKKSNVSSIKLDLPKVTSEKDPLSFDYLYDNA